MTEIGVTSPGIAGGEKTELRQIVVLGMHRSGTSAITALINSLGAFAGSEEELTGAGPENPRGFFERHDIRKLCDGLLHSAGADWWKMAEFDIARVPQEAAVESGEQLTQILAELDRHGTWVIKEPRLCLLLPFFRRYLERPAVVFVARNPLEIANSLRQRNGFPRTVGLALWEAYCVAALHSSADLPRIIVRYRDITDDPAHAAEDIHRKLLALGVGGLKLPSHGVIDPLLRRQSCDDREFAALATEEQKALWAMICHGRADTTFPPAVSCSARAVLDDFEQDQTALAQLETLARRAGHLGNRSGKTHAKSGYRRIADLEAEISARKRQLGLTPEEAPAGEAHLPPAPDRSKRPIKWLSVLATILRHSGGLNRKSRQLLRDYLTIHRSGRF